MTSTSPAAPRRRTTNVEPVAATIAPPVSAGSKDGFVSNERSRHEAPSVEEAATWGPPQQPLAMATNPVGKTRAWSKPLSFRAVASLHVLPSREVQTSATEP